MVLCAAVWATPVLAQDSQAATPEQERRIQALWSQVVCSCPRENWTRTLLSCVDDCSAPQRSEVRQGVLAGRSDQEILEAQVAQYGPRARAAPEFGSRGGWVYVLPFVALAAGALLVLSVLAGWARASRERRADEALEDPAAPPTEAELDAVERELGELD